MAENEDVSSDIENDELIDAEHAEDEHEHEHEHEHVDSENAQDEHVDSETNPPPTHLEPRTTNFTFAAIILVSILLFSLLGGFAGSIIFEEKGPAGDTGEIGVTGANGIDGGIGTDGSPGVDGTNGTDGDNALNALVNSTLEPVGLNCVNGGIRIDVGVDNDANGVLETTEIDQTQYVCDGGSSSSTMLTTITSPLESMNCDAGGQVISHGLDNGEENGIAANGVLESGEIDSTTTVCSKDVTEMVMDINSGSGDSAPFEFTAIGNTLYFRAYTVINGDELWKSDGTAAGTMMVKDINNGSDYGSPYLLTAVGNTLYFRADDGINGRELWKSDGTASGTVMVKDINNGSDDGSPYGFTAVGNTLYFRADDGINGRELWKSDGTEAGTMMVKDIKNGSGYGPFEFTAVGNTIYFQADDGTSGDVLWKSNGTANGTMMVKDINFDDFQSNSNLHLTPIGNTLYFRAYGQCELWKSDGTAAGTVMVKDINNGCDDGSPHLLTAIGNTLYFQADNGINGSELWMNKIHTEVTYS